MCLHSSHFIIKKGVFVVLTTFSELHFVQCCVFSSRGMLVRVFSPILFARATYLFAYFSFSAASSNSL